MTPHFFFVSDAEDVIGDSRLGDGATNKVFGSPAYAARLQVWVAGSTECLNAESLWAHERITEVYSIAKRKPERRGGIGLQNWLGTRFEPDCVIDHGHALFLRTVLSRTVLSESLNGKKTENTVPLRPSSVLLRVRIKPPCF